MGVYYYNGSPGVGMWVYELNWPGPLQSVLAGNFLTSCKTFSFSRRIPYHGVSK